MKILYKLIIWPLVIIFLSQNIAWTAPNISPQSIVHGSQSLINIHIPEQYGRIDKSIDYGPWTMDSKQPLVVLVKDAHCHYEAQKNIQNILDTLIRDYKFNLICTEGASGFVNPSIVLKTNPKEETRKRVADKFLKTGLLTASEALSINKGREPGFTIWGVEDLKLYLNDYKAFRETIGVNPNGRHFIEILTNLISQLKKRIYSGELEKFDELVTRYELNKISLTGFIKKLYSTYGIPKEYQNLKLILKSIRLEERIEFGKVEKERTELIRQLEKTRPREDLQELVTKSLLFKLGKIPAVEYYTYLNGKTINPVRSRTRTHTSATSNGVNLKRYTRLVNLQSRIDESALFNELEDITEKIYAKLCRDKISHDLRLLDKDINILNKILSIEATREDLVYFKENYERFNPENLLRFIKIQAPLHNINLPPEINSPSFIEDAAKTIIPAEEFYGLAIERDKALVENLIQKMDKDKKDKAILVCGGFHIDGIRKLLEGKGISTLTITPSITKLQEDSREIYLNRMLDERINPQSLLNELGIENLSPIVSTSQAGQMIGLPEPIRKELKKYGYEVKGEFTEKEFKRLLPLLQELYNKAEQEGNTTLKDFLKQLPGIETPPSSDKDLPKIFDPRFVGITPQNLIFRLSDTDIIGNSRELHRFRQVIPELLKAKSEIRGTEEPSDILDGKGYPYNCARCASRASRILRRYGFPAEIREIKFPEERFPRISRHTFVVTRINGKDVIVDIAADQFEPVGDVFKDLDVVILPIEVVKTNPDRYWMYTTNGIGDIGGKDRGSARTYRAAHIIYMNVPKDSNYYSSGLERNGKTTVEEIKEDLRKEGTSKLLTIEGKNAMVDNNLLQGLGKTDQEFLAVLSRALAEAKKFPGADLANLKDTIAIALLDKSSHLAEDHVANGFIGINRLAIEIYKQIQEQFGKDTADNFIQFLLIHELVHELTGKGEEIESELIKDDAERFIELFPEDIIQFLTSWIVVDENFINEVKDILMEEGRQDIEDALYEVKENLKITTKLLRELVEEDTLHMKSMKLRKGSKYYADRLQINGQDVDINSIKGQISGITSWQAAPAMENKTDGMGITELESGGSSIITVNGKRITIFKLTFSGKTFYITSDTIMGFGPDNFLNIIKNALLALQGEGKDISGLPDGICIFNLSGSPYLFEDHTKNGFIGVNEALVNLYTNPSTTAEQKQLLSSLLQIGLEHELLHELGETDETILKERDIKRINQLLKYPKDIRQLFQIIENAVEIDHDFKAGVIAELAERYCRSNSLPRLNLKDIINKPLPNGEGTQRRIMEYLIRFFDCGFLLILNLDELRNQNISEELIGITLEGIMEALGMIPLRKTNESVIPLKIKYDPNWEAGGTTAWKRGEEVLTIPKDITVNVNVTESFNPINTFLHELAHYKWFEMQLPGKPELEALLKKFLEEIGLVHLYRSLNIHELVAYTAASGDIGDFIKSFVTKETGELQNTLAYRNFEASVTRLLKIHLFRNTEPHPRYPRLFSYEWPRCQKNSTDITVKKGWLRHNEDGTWHELMDEELLLTLSQNISTENGKALAKTLAEKVSLSEKFADIERLFNTIGTLENKEECYKEILYLINTPMPIKFESIIGLLAKIAERAKADAYKAYAALSKLIGDVSCMDENMRNIVLDISLLTTIAENSTNIAYSYSYLNSLTEEIDKALSLPDWFTLDLLMNIAKQGNSREYFSCLVENRGDLQDYWLAEGVLGYLQEKMSRTATSAATTPKAPESNDAIKKGRVPHKTVNRQIRKAILEGKAYKVWNRAVRPQKGDKEISVNTEEENYIEQCKRFLPREYPGYLDTVDIVIIKDKDFLYFRNDNNHQSAHAGHRRRTCYLGEGLYNKIKNNPQTLAATIAHEIFHITNPEGNENKAEAVEIRIDPEKNLRKAIDELLSQGQSKEVKLKKFFSTSFPRFFRQVHFGSNKPWRLEKRLKAKAHKIDEQFATYIERIAPLIARGSHSESRYEVERLCRELNDRYLVAQGFYIYADSFMLDVTHYLKLRCYQLHKRPYSDSLPPQLSILQDRVYLMERLDSLEQLYLQAFFNLSTYLHRIGEGLIPSDELQNIADDASRIRQGGEYLPDSPYDELGNLQTALLRTDIGLEDISNIKREIEDSFAIGECHLLQGQNEIPYSLTLPYELRTPLIRRYDDLLFIARIAFGNVPFIEISRMLQYEKEHNRVSASNNYEPLSAAYSFFLLARKLGFTYEKDQLRDWDILRKVVKRILALSTEELQRIAREIYEEELIAIRTQIPQAPTRTAPSLPPSSGLPSTVPERGTEAVTIDMRRNVLEELPAPERETGIPQHLVPFTERAERGETEREPAETSTSPETPGVRYEYIYRYTKANRGEEYYLNQIRQARVQLERTTDIEERIRIFLAVIWPQYLMALDDDSCGTSIEEQVIETARRLDEEFSGQIARIIPLARGLSNPTTAARAKERIKEIAAVLRSNRFLIGHRFFLDTEVLERTNLQTHQTVWTLSSISYRIDRTNTYQVKFRGRNSTWIEIHFLGERVDRINQQREALGYTFLGDTFGVVVKKVVRDVVNMDIIPTLNGVPFADVRVHPINETSRRAVLRDGLPAHPAQTQLADIYERFYRSTEIHELDHKIVECTERLAHLRNNPFEQRIRMEASAYLASIIDGPVPYSDLITILRLILGFRLALFDPYKPAGVLIFTEFARELGILDTVVDGIRIDEQNIRNGRLDTLNIILERLIKLNANRLRILAKKIRENILNIQTQPTQAQSPVPTSVVGPQETSTTTETRQQQEEPTIVPTVRNTSTSSRFNFARIRIALFVIILALLAIFIRSDSIITNYSHLINSAPSIAELVPSRVQEKQQERASPRRAIEQSPELEYIVSYREYHVKPGESWRLLAKRFLGNEASWPILWHINDRPPTLLRNSTIKIPIYTLPDGKEFPVYVTIPHVVKPGESLSKIAKKYYGASNAWHRIHRDNPDIKDANRIEKGQIIKIRFYIRKTCHTLKAPGSIGLDEDSGAKEYVERIVNNPDNIAETIQEENATIHTLELGDILGIPRFSGATKPQDLVYAYGKNINGRLHIYVTTAFWDVLQENPLMLAFLIDHEYQENILGKSHAEASKRAWDFVDEYGMNAFYRFFIDHLAEKGEIEYLKKLTAEHPNDPRGRFRDYVLETLAIKIPLRLQKELDKCIEDGNIEQEKAILLKLKQIHTIIEELMTENGTISTLVFEKLENILWDILRKGNLNAKVNLMCVALPMALLNPLGYDVANDVKRIFYEKIRDYIASKKPRELEERGIRQAYAQLSGQYYGFSKTRLFVIGLNEDDFGDVKRLFEETLIEVGIKDTKKYTIYAGHMLISLENRKDIQKKYNSKDYKAVSSGIEEMIIDAIKETTGRAEVAEKVLRQDILGQKHKRLLSKNRKAIARGRDKFIPENEYETGKIPRLSHEIGHLNKLWDELNTNKLGEQSYNAYIECLNKSILRAFQDIRYKRAYKKSSSGAVIMAWRDGTLSSYISYLREKGFEGFASSWDYPLKMTKMGDEIWLYIKTDRGIVQVFLELDKFNAFNGQYYPDARDSFYHQILDAIFGHYERNKDNLDAFISGLEDAILDTPIKIPDDKTYRDGYTSYPKPAEIFEIEVEPIKTVRSGEQIRLRKLVFHYTEKLKGQRVPLYQATLDERQMKVVVYERRIYTADGKEDVTDELLSRGWKFKPFIGPIGATVTTDLHSLTGLDPYIISKLNTYQKKNLREINKKPMDISTITAHRIRAILRKHGIEIDEKTLIDTMIKVKNGKIKIDFMRLWVLIKERIKQPEKFFEIAADISRPLNTLLGPEARIKGAQVMNAILYEVLNKLPAEERKAIKQTITEKLRAKKDIEHDEAELLETIKILAAKKGIDPNAIQSIFDLFKQGLEILIMDPDLDPGQIDGSYFTLIQQLCGLTGISESVIMNAFKDNFGINVKITQGEIIPHSILWKETQRLAGYRSFNENYCLSELKDSKLWHSDFSCGKAYLKGKDEYERTRYLSGLDAVSKDVKAINSALRETPLKGITESITTVGVIYHISDYITFHTDGTFSYKPGIEAIFRNMEGGINIAFITPKNLEARARAALESTGRFGKNIFMGSTLEETQGILLERQINPENIAYMANEKESKKQGFTDKIKGIKTIVLTEDSSFHASLIFAVLYARVSTNEINTLIWRFLDLMGYKDDEIREVISDFKKHGFFTVRLIRIADTLKEFQNRKIFIDVAA